MDDTLKEEDNLTLRSAFAFLPLGRIRPEGWLRNQLQIQRDGFTGHLEEHWHDVGPNSGWLGGSGEGWERGPYYVDGLLPLAYLLEDEELILKARKWVEWTLLSQRVDGSFGPHELNTMNREIQNQDWWQDFIMLKVLTQYAEVTNDDRVEPFLTRYFYYLKDALQSNPLREWAEARGAELLLSIQWLYERTGDAALLELSEIVSQQMIDWGAIFEKFPYTRKQREWDHRVHVVNLAMGVKAPAVLYRQTADESQRQAVDSGIKSLMMHHGQAHGMFSGDEWLSGTHPSQGVELCAVVEYMFSMEHLVRIFGDGAFGDTLEKVSFNALPAAISPEWDSHQYDQQVNQVMCNAAKRPWVNKPDSNQFGLEPNFGCCTANMHQGWPKYCSSLWMSTYDNGLAAVSYAPCHVNTTLPGNNEIELDVQTEYPFREHVLITLTLKHETRFPMWLRIPGWCQHPQVKVNGNLQKINIENGFTCIERSWHDQDCVEIFLPMQVEVSERGNRAISVQRGPLVYVLPIAEQWVQVCKRERFHDWEVYPMSAWRYGLEVDGGFQVETQNISYQPYRAESAPVKLITKGRLVSNWFMEDNSAGEPPANPIPYSNVVETLELIPYGCARLRIGEFPVLR
ncbi:beta-L-arabinofuranosidase domain-containing protein [Alicyclobacillus ferrooxydans]|uniref:beta-L-arabinofuranosidase domain-containing protein n=1 Tax=Alicyclobacillus ferrooxydans TaxID=471514 RepID=UPI000A6A7749|nr:beta-L-arabinofuranosidase domain-containing protein [Alicyclobacillus ferrooxydans]